MVRTTSSLDTSSLPVVEDVGLLRKVGSLEMTALLSEEAVPDLDNRGSREIGSPSLEIELDFLKRFKRLVRSRESIVES